MGSWDGSAIACGLLVVLTAATPAQAEDGLPGGPPLTAYGKRLLTQAGILDKKPVVSGKTRLSQVGGITFREETEPTSVGGKGRLEAPLLRPPGGKRVLKRITEPPALPKGTPAMRFNGRHELGRLELFTGRCVGRGRTAYLLETPTPKALDRLYREAVAFGPAKGPVRLQNGQTWHIDAATGRFFPLSGPGTVRLTAGEARLLQDLKRAIQNKKKSPSEALLGLDRATRAIGYSFSRDMAWALARAGGSLGFTDDEVRAVLGARIREGVAAQRRREATAKAKAKAKQDDEQYGGGE